MKSHSLMLLALLLMVSFYKVANGQKSITPQTETKHTSYSKQGPILHLPFNGNAKDHSGHNNSGIVLGAKLTTDRFGEKNRAYLFDGNSSRIEVADKKELRPPCTSLQAGT